MKHFNYTGVHFVESNTSINIKNFIILFLGIFSIPSLYGQVGINTTAPQTTLDVRAQNHLGQVSSTDGVLVPRVSNLSANGSINGQLVYLITDSDTFTAGFYYWNGSKWAGLAISGVNTIISDNSLWMTDAPNNKIKLNSQSNVAMPRDLGTELVVMDNGSVGIGTHTPHQSSILDIKSSSKGILIPHVTLNNSYDQTTVPSPAKGLLVYNTGEGLLKFHGFTFWNGHEWRSLDNTTTINPAISSFNCGSATAYPLTFTSGTPYSGVLTVPYSGGNGAHYETDTSFTLHGLTFQLNPGTLNNGNGTITYSITGIPDFSSPNTISVPLSIFGYNCIANIGNNSSNFSIGEIKSARITIPASQFTKRPAAGSVNVMSGKAVINKTTVNNRNQSYPLASLADQTKFIIINGLRMDFIQSWGTDTSVSPKFYNTTSNNISYTIASLSTNDANTQGAGTILPGGYYSYNIDGNDDFSCTTGGQSEYVNVMITFDNGEWYNCTWHATRDITNYYLYMTAQRLN